MPDNLQWFRLMSMSWLGATLQASLIKKFGTPNKAANANINQITSIEGFDYKRADRFLKEYCDALPICDDEQLEKAEVQFVNYNDKNYPQLLKEIPDAPIGLFVKGNISLDNKPTLAIVGARNGTETGYDITKEFAKELSEAGFAIVSGLALGIDTYAHLGALEGEGKTIAVLACGPDIAYPKGNIKVRNKILEKNGALVSEYPPGKKAFPWHFPVRNRIISGMSLGTLVVEANAQSGSLITAHIAVEQNRDVFAIPGNIRSACAQGTISLIKDGANVVTDPSELINYYESFLPKNLKKQTEKISLELSEDERKLIKTLSNEPNTVDKLLENGWKAEKLFSLLLQLEMRDYILKLPNNSYQAKIRI